MAGNLDALRASDSDREIVAEQLRIATEAGRLTVAEFDDRVQHVYAAKTYGDLKALLVDLPVIAPRPSTQLAHTQPLTRDAEIRCVAVSTALFLLIMAIAIAAILMRAVTGL